MKKIIIIVDSLLFGLLRALDYKSWQYYENFKRDLYKCNFCFCNMIRLV